MVEDILAILGQDIFAIAVSAFLLVRVESKLDDLTIAITKLSVKLLDEKNIKDK
ncbi:YvrJ family protein [Vagococcus luciliae]|uniref:YvrJ family protein n=1 Tax=Vagococcus luciliae TaxID=2920380 RepID=A0ABY5P2Q6_9ENTE|nr:YvrJ family protein [Vagococcus luciliae]UUV99921.1 hypothetical protein G314FT_20900 [Vagococcus luciliae]